ncbi:DUF2510 domain-containing protein, partial [Streptomyces sp. KR55]|uniref:DUF2510 domain-containing protein n=1 Tax=Streptomyces sp. KR55 TaxID=3457425 RepID=UPI003FD26152
MTPPPGWYRDPSAPHVERWWDGTAWTDHRRTPEVPGPPSPTAGTSARAKAVALTAAGVVLVAAIVTGAVVLGDDGNGGGTEANTAAPTPATTSATPAPSASTPEPSAATFEPSADDPAVVVDELNGITLPLLDGWVRPENVTTDNVMMTTDGTYDCPGDGGFCRHGLVISRTVTENDEQSPEALAKAD